jgi:hypothetical protein
MLAEKVRRRVVHWFRIERLLDADAAADMLAWESSGFSIDASVRIAIIDRDVPSDFQSLEHLLRSCAGHAPDGCCDPREKPRSYNIARIAWATLMARVGRSFRLRALGCGGDIRLRGDGRQEPAHAKREVRRREKARIASSA